MMKFAPIIVIIVSYVIVGIIIYLLYRRTNILLDNFNHLQTDVRNIQKYLEQSSTPNIVNSPIPNISENKEIPDNVIDADPNNIEVRENMISQLKFEINNLENLITSSDDESKSEEVVQDNHTTGEFAQAKKVSFYDDNMLPTTADINASDTDDDADDDDAQDDAQDADVEDMGEDVIDPNNILSYDLAGVDDTNSELEGLIDQSNDISLSNLEEIINNNLSSLVENQQNFIPEVTTKSKEVSSDVKTEITLDIIMSKFNKRELENLCGSYSLSKSGNKTLLINRLIKYGHIFGIDIVENNEENTITSN